MHQRQVFRLERWQHHTRLLIQLHHILWIAAEHDRFNEPAVQVAVRPARRLDILRLICQRQSPHQVQRNADFARQTRFAERLHDHAVADVHMIGRAHCGGEIMQSRRHAPLVMPQERRAIRLVERDKMLHPAP